MIFIVRVIAVLSLSAIGFCQLPSSDCDLSGQALAQCPYLTSNQASENPSPSYSNPSAAPDGRALFGNTSSTSAESSNAGIAESLFAQQPAHKKQGFHWGRALLESFMFLSIEQAYVVHDDYKWVVVENGVPFNHYWRDYTYSLHTWLESGWNDGDPLMYGYLGHPIQGAFTSFIQIQNDPRGENLEFSNTKEYWHSRLRATIWNAVYSTQWNLGPLSEITVEKYGTKRRGPWNQNGTWPCTSRYCYTGVGQIDLVMTPIGGFAWMLGEDILDNKIARRVEGTTRNRFLIDFTRCALNPIRGGASILHGRAPWYRARDATEVYFLKQAKKFVPPQSAGASSTQ